MEESTINGLGLNDRVIRLPRNIRRVCVEGYDTSLYEYDLKLALTKHFASCGEIVSIHVPRNYEKGILERLSFIRFDGEGAQEKALQLSGTDVGGWTVFAKAYPSQGEEDITGPADRAAAAEGVGHFDSERTMVVTGYDNSLPEIDLQIGLSKYFSSCGEVTGVMILDRKALVDIMGEGAIDKALELSGCDVGGWKIEVVNVFPPQDAKRNCPTGNLRPNRELGWFNKKNVK